MKPHSLPDQSGKVIVITGATSGIGKETARSLVAAGATVVVASRNPAKIQSTVDELSGDARDGGAVQGVELDLASFASTRAGAAEVLDRWDRLDVLINNAGVYLSERSVTAEGFEMTFGTNHLGHFLLTNLLLDRLRASAPSRVVNLSSIGHRFTRGMNWDDLQSKRHYSIQEAYTQSKLANVLFTKELARRERDHGVSVFAVHPGNIRSGFGQDGDARGVMGGGLKAVRWLMAGSRLGSAASLYVATTPGLESRTGGYFQRSPVGGFRSVHESKPSKAARDDASAKRLWDLSEQMVAGVTAS